MDTQTPIMHRTGTGFITIEWGTPDNKPGPWPVLIAPELLIEMVDAFNDTLLEATP